MTTLNQTEAMVRTSGAARLTGLSISTLNKLRLYGRGPRYAKLGRTVVYDPSDIAHWVEARKRSSTSVER